MLQTIREHTQGWIAGTIISIIILTFALWGIHSYFVGGVNNNIVANVNGVEVTKDQLTAAYERLRRQAQSQYGLPVAGKEESALKQRALQSLIEIEVLKQASLSQGFRISNQQVDTYLQSMPEFQVSGQFSVARFQEILSASLMSTGEFLDLIRSSLLIEQPKLGIVLTSFALADEKDTAVSLINQERDISYITIPLQYFLSQPMTIAPEKMASYYESHKNEFMTPEQVNVEYIQLSSSDLATSIPVSDAALQNLYHENINAYTQPTVWKLTNIVIPLSPSSTVEQIAQARENADKVMKMLKDGNDFVKLAKQYSSTQLENQGLLTLKQVPGELQKTVADMTTVNQISDPVQTSYGFVILKVLDYKEPQIQSFDSVKDKVTQTYIRQRTEEKFAELRDQLANITYEHPDSLDVAAKTLKLPIQTSELFAKDKAGKGISQYKKVREMAYSNDVLNLQNNSDIVQLTPETIIVLHLKSHVASTLLPLKEVTTKIENKLKDEEAQARASRFAADFIVKLHTGMDAEQLANNNKLVWDKPGFIGRYSTKVIPAILETVFRLPNPTTVQKKVLYEKTRLPNGYAIVALKSVRNGFADEKQDAIFAEQVQNSEGKLEYELYKRSQMNSAKIQLPLR